jgi:phosphatidylserine/phosphatidylglycerophosphate/cardiolipin synthase-like enzyme
MNYELGLFVEDAGFAEHVRRELMEVQAAKSKPVTPVEGRDATIDAIADRFWKLL